MINAAHFEEFRSINLSKCLAITQQPQKKPCSGRTQMEVGCLRRTSDRNPKRQTKTRGAKTQVGNEDILVILFYSSVLILQ